MKIVAIIPAYNEEERVAAAIADAARFVDDVVVVDDCSKDRTGEAAFESGAYLLQHVINRGQGAALQTGTEFALEYLGADIVIHFDADGQMCGEDIEAVTEPIIKGEASVVLGSRFLGARSNMPLGRWLTLRCGLLFTAMVSGIKVTDTHNGFRALSRNAAQDIKITIDRMAHASEILDLIKAKKLVYVERPVKIRYSEETLAKGQSFFGAFIVIKDFFKAKFFDEL
ncbi:glycosyltransferase family 2 protein [Patescibacteria group bacterium]|nr:glycosyltransferase family 2 protein [Patescibacteria group bacterium]